MKKIYCRISISDKTAILFLCFFNFNPLPFTVLFFFPYLFRFNSDVSERNVHILFCRHIWAELSPPLLDISEPNFVPRCVCVCGGGGGVHVHPVHPPLRTRLKGEQKHRTKKLLSSLTSWLYQLWFNSIYQSKHSLDKPFVYRCGLWPKI